MNIQKIQTEYPVYTFTVLVLLFVLTRYGKEAMEWVLTKLHEFFIQRYIF